MYGWARFFCASLQYFIFPPRSLLFFIARLKKYCMHPVVVALIMNDNSKLPIWVQLDQ